MAETDWTARDWETLDRLREVFLAGSERGSDDYWTSTPDVALYDRTYGQRIAWKWDAVLDEVGRLGWLPPAPAVVLDWGCGSGIAGRSVVEAMGPARVSRLVVHDRSGLAAEFATATARSAFPGLTVERASPGWLAGAEPIGILVLSHVLNELDDPTRAAVLRLAARATAVLWVEPGTHADSRRLIAVREALRPHFRVVAPCTHQETCGLLTADNQRHWCHYFAAPPAGIMADPDWVRFAHRAGIDLRSLPYSYLVLEKRDRQPAPADRPDPRVDLGGWSRVLAEPRLYKGFARFLSCQQDGVRELILQKRDDPVLFKRLKGGRWRSLFRWDLDDDRIARTAEWPAADAP